MSRGRVGSATKDSADELPAYMSISMRSALGERTMLETPILIVIIVLVIAAVVWWLYR